MNGPADPAERYWEFISGDRRKSSTRRGQQPNQMPAPSIWLCPQLTYRQR